MQSDYSEHTETNTIIMMHLNSRDNACYHLGKISESGEDWIGALDYYGQALNLTEPYLDCYNRMGWCAYHLGLIRGKVSCALPRISPRFG